MGITVLPSAVRMSKSSRLTIVKFYRTAPVPSKIVILAVKR
ncbi:hypothetical protein CKA32_003018 [Geitlerinema sp. FC II]|nr:hypothetical protein CKA32_003018 [Geitlerinema sp. FC II]